jgi:hypothetical protein
MKKFALAALLVLVYAAPAFAWHKKLHKDPRVVAHPQAIHPRNPAITHRVKPKVNKHHV